MASSGRIWWGLVLIVLGVLFLFDNIRLIDFGEILHTWWPLLLVIWGLAILVRRMNIPQVGDAKPGATSDHLFGDTNEQSTADRISYSGVFGDTRVRVSSSDFKGGTVSTVFGDTLIDLSPSSLHDGENTLKVSGVFGDIDVIAPREAGLAVSATTVFGNLTVNEMHKEGFSSSVQYESPGYVTAPKKLRIVMSQVFGDVSVRG
jgi:predicted membrane protein